VKVRFRGDSCKKCAIHGRISKFDSLAYSTLPSDAEKQLVAKISAVTAYFDASGHPSDQPFVVVSGYVANHLQWQYFNKAWELVHANAGISSPFHSISASPVNDAADDSASSENNH